ncbi:CIR protein [Plasmodium chabaudi chabaudi]|uniref:CIR protein n=1 Tax=Plasmodium chabaudi chabaudi TaxID=31271 RepID=Q7YZ88_PLACU|nr:CIR protein [Plasmodium chabaudi chabaudi]AAO06128.1 PC10102c [Plasmodium chabaudi chabaudi]VTZ68196.1 CIR protein [Plasmodium chabaudi chabaudi]|eukprot:XP_016652869.1 CIR protein [Plasmodium chabaudi chabaudi]
MSKKLCGLINVIDHGVKLTMNGTNVQIKNDATFNDYCPNEGMKTNGECDSNIQNVNSAIIKLLTYFKSVVDDILEDNKLSEYAILWLCYKLNLMSYEGISNINDFHNKYIKDKESDIQKIVDVEAYNIYKDLINKKGDLVNMDIKIMSKFYETLKFLCKLYTGCNEKETNYPNCSQDANAFVKEFQKLNDDCNITGNNSYSQILYSLSTDYKNLKNDCAKKCTGCKDIPTLPNIKTPQNSIECSAQIRVQDKGESPGQGSEAILSGSSVASKLIPALLVFAMPVFLGIAYKYSLFGFGKRSQKRYLRENIKK